MYSLGMKKKIAIIGFVLLAILAVLPFGLDVLTPQKVSKVEFLIEGMTCEACEVTLKKAVEKLPGVVSATFSHTEKTGTIMYKPKHIGMSQLAQAIEDKNYIVVEQQGSKMKVIDMGIQMQGLGK